MTLPDGTLFFLSSEQTDSGTYYCVVQNERGADIEISYEAVVKVMSDDEYYDYQDEVDDHAEDETKIVDTIINDQVEDEGKIVMEIEATAVDNSHKEEEEGRQEIPLVFWVICLSIVSCMTVLVIFGAGFIIYKIRNMKQSAIHDMESGQSIYERPSCGDRTTKRLSWIETPWNFYPSSQQLKTFRNQSHQLQQSPTNSSSDYDYAASDYFLLSKSPSENSSHKYIFKSNHYASSNINN